MSNLSLSFSLPLVTLLTAAVANAQDLAAWSEPAPSKQAIQLAMPAADFGLFLLAVTDRRVRLVKADLLVDAIPVFATENGSQLVADLDLPDADLRFYWQSLAVDGTSLRIGAIQSVDTTQLRKPIATMAGDLAAADQEPAAKPASVKDDLARAPVKADQAQAPVKSDQAQAPVKSDMAQAPVKADLPTADKSTNQDGGGQPTFSDLPIALAATMSGRYLSSIQASFTAPNDGYALRLLEVVGQPGGMLDVYLYRKLPGEGEGLLDIVEEHSVKVQLRASSVRVFLGEGTEPRPSEDVTWRRLAVLPQ